MLFGVFLLLPGVHSWAQSDAGRGTSTLPRATQEGQASRPAAQSTEAAEGERDENEQYRQSAVVKAIGGKMGMKPAAASTLFEVINFVVLAVLVGWFLTLALPKMFRDRTSSIQKSLVDARTATEEAGIRLNSVEDRLSKLDGQIAAMRSQADVDAVNEERRIKASVEEEKSKVLQAAEQEIAAATAQARRHIQQYAAELAVDQAARKLVITAETDRLLIDSFARRLGGDDPKKEQN